MKHALQLCSAALNPNAPSPTATMVRVADGQMTAFGGLFAINVPMEVEVGACFSPSLVGTFFRKERKTVSYTLHKGKLVLQEGKEKLSVPFLPPEELVTLDVLAKPVPVTLDLSHLRSCTSIVDPAHSKVQCQGINFRYGMMESSNGNVVVSAITDLPEEFDFNMPLEAACALVRFKSPIVAMCQDQRAVKFIFEDGSSLVSLLLYERLIETVVFYKGDWTPLNLTGEFAKDLLTLPCEMLTFENGDVTYTSGESSGTISKVVDKNIRVVITKIHMDILLKISSDIRISEESFRMMAVSDNCRAITTTRNFPK